MSLPRALLLAAASTLTLHAVPGLIDLGTLGGANSSIQYGGSGSVNSAASYSGSVLVGQSNLPFNNATHAFIYQGGAMTDIGTLGGDSSWAMGVSSNGLVVIGQSYLSGSGNSHAFIYQGGVMTDIGTLGGDYSWARGVSADGSVVVGGSSLAGNNIQRAFIYSGGGMTDIGTLGGDSSWVSDVSDGGSIVVGNSYLAGNNIQRAFIYSGGVMTDIGTLGGDSSWAAGVSADGRVVAGNSYLAGNNTQHAFIYSGGVMTDIGSLGGSYSSVVAISDDGSVLVGNGQSAGSNQHAFMYAYGVMTDIHPLLVSTLGAGDGSGFFGLSGDGSVGVGYYYLPDYSYRGFYYANGAVTDIGDLGAGNTYAAGISGDGSTLYGNALTIGGDQRAVVLYLTPPAPTTITATIAASDSRVTSGGALQFQGGTLAPVGTGALTLVNDITVLASSTGTLDATTQDIASTGAVTINGTSLTLTGSATSAISLAGLVSGTGGLINNGGVNTLAQSSTYTGATVVNAGKLIQVGTSQSSSNQIAAGATLEFNQASGSVSSGNTTFTGAGILLKTGAGSLGWGVTSATFSFSHGAMIHVAEGNFIGGSNWSEVWTDNHSDLRVDAGARFSGVEADVRIDRLLGAGVVSTGLADPRYHGFTTGVDGGDSFFTGTIIDSDTASGAFGKIVKVGAGELTLTGSNTYSGGTTLQAGALRAGNNAAFGSGAITLNAGVLSSDGSAARTLANDVNVAGDVILGDAVKDGVLTLAGAVSVSSGTTITFASDVTLSGTATSTGVFTKAGTGVLTLDAAGTIAAGTLVVSAGRLTNNGTINGAVTVANGATLEGAGSVNGAITIAGAGASGQAGALVFELGASPTTSTSAVTLSGDAKISVTATGILNLDGTIDASAPGKVLTIDTGLGAVFQHGAVGANVAQLVKEGSGWLSLRAGVAGTIVLNQGACSAAVAGSTGAGVTVNAGTSLWLSSDAGTPITFAAPLALAGSTALHLDSTAAVTQSGQVTLDADTTITSLSSNNVISGAIGGATPGQNLTLLVSDHALKLTGTTDASVAQVTKDGAGTLLVDTTGVINSGSIVVSAGLLTDNGAINGAVSVTTNGTLGGSGTISGAVNVGGTLAPGNSPGVQTQVSGNTTLSSGAHFQAQLGGTTPGNGDGFHDQYDVQAGRFNLDPGVTLDVRSWVKADGVTTFVPARRDVFTIIHASNGIAGVFSDLTNADYSQWMLFDNASTLHPLGKLYGTGLNGNQTFAAYGDTPARAAIGASLWAAAVTASNSSTTAHPAGFLAGDTSLGLAAISLLSTPSPSAVLDALSPEAYLAVGDYALTVSRSLTDAAFTQNSLIKTGAWTVGAGFNRAEHAYVATGAAQNYRLTSDSPIVTVAFDFGPHCSVGFFYGQNHGKTLADAARIDYRGGVFGLTSVGRIPGAYPVTLKGAVVASDLRFEASRAQGEPIGTSTSGQRKVRSVGGQLTAAVELYKDGRLTVSPTLGFVQGRSTTNAFNEAGTGANLALDAMAQDSSRLVAGFGLTYLASSDLVFDVSAAFEHEYASDAGVVTASFEGSAVSVPMTIERSIADRDSTTFGLGASWKLDNSCTLRLGAEVRGNRELRNDHRYNASVNVRF